MTSSNNYCKLLKMSTYNKKLVIFCNIYPNIVNIFSVIVILLQPYASCCFYINIVKSILCFVIFIQFRIYKYENLLYVAIAMSELIVLLIICILSINCSEKLVDVIYNIMSYCNIIVLYTLFKSNIKNNTYVQIPIQEILIQKN
jgi:hypothetical protein